MRIKTNHILALLITIVVGIAMTSCTNDDFTDKKEIIKGSWYAENEQGWKSIEFCGDHWRGTYFYNETGLIFVSGKYKWEDDEQFIHLTGTTSSKQEFDLRMIYRWGTYQQLRLDGTPKNPRRGTLFYHYVD